MLAILHFDVPLRLFTPKQQRKHDVGAPVEPAAASGRAPLLGSGQEITEAPKAYSFEKGICASCRSPGV